MTNKKDEFNNISEPEKRLQYLYNEIFYLTDKIEQVHEHQKELGQLVLNLIKEIQKHNEININKYFK